MARWLSPLPLLLALFLLPGCAGFGFLATMGGEKVRAQYVLPPRTTLVMVDDPQMRLQDPSLRGVIATNVTFYLEQNKAVGKTARVVPYGELAAVIARLGDDYPRTPISQVGQMVGADQVIHVLVESMALQSDVGLYRPTAVVQVKVIDTATGERLFPAALTFADPKAPPPGKRVTTQTQARPAAQVDASATVLLARELAEQTGRVVAEMFYDHKKPEPGSTLP